MRYEACIIGAGPDGLAAAALLAARGLKVLVVERAVEAGGPCISKTLAPGYTVSPFADELPAIPPAIFRSLDLARRGVFLAAEERVPSSLDDLRAAVIARVLDDAARPLAPRWPFFKAPAEPAFPGEEVTARDGRALAGMPGGLVKGGLGALGRALYEAARDAGAEFSLGLEATDIRRKRGRAVAVGLADGREIEARAVISTLDLKRTFLSLFAWNDLPKPLVERISTFRTAPGIARLLVALPSLPETGDMARLRRPIILPCDAARAFNAYKSGIVPDRPPCVVRLVSATDPSLAPDNRAVATVTLEHIPFQPFDGPWTHEKRLKLKTLAFALLDEALPGSSAAVVASELIVPPDIENLLGLTEGDMCGGELSPAQMLAFRPFAECRGTRTPVAGLYLAGPSSTLGPVATCASGWAAAHAVLADRKAAA